MHYDVRDAERRARNEQSKYSNHCLLLGCCGIYLVLLSIFSRHKSSPSWLVAQNMALVQAFLISLELLGIILAFASLGYRILRSVHWKTESAGEHFLVAAAIGLVTTEILLFLIQFTHYIKQGCWGIAVCLCIVLILDWKEAWSNCRRIAHQTVPASQVGRFLLVLIAIAVFVAFLSSLAPLTGSDALHYHFTVQKEILELGFHPIFSNSHSFLCGQHHLLILFGLALGSEKLALGLIFVGGVLTASSLACLASLWARDWIVAGFTLLFLLTPITFWQIVSSGSPDIYMAFLATTAVIVLRRTVEGDTWRQALLAGYLVGGIAGAKYTGCIIATAFALVVLVELRSKLTILVFFPSVLATGIWPYLRNLLWTGNPVFPFLSARLSPHLVTAYAMQDLARDTGASSTHGLALLFPFLFFAVAQQHSPGFWDFFGPTVLALAPLILFAFRSTKAWRVPLLVWFFSNLGIFFSSGLPRFLLPLFPMALSCVAAGFDVSVRARWKIISRTATGLLVVTGCVGAVGFVLYVQAPLRPAIGLQAQNEYLKLRAPDFEIAETASHLLSGRKNQQKTLVFFRHLYYLNIPFVNGDPSTSFEVDPERMQTPQAWEDFLGKNGIGYIVRSPDYPEKIAAPLHELEKTGELIPFASADVQNFQGKRLEQNRTAVRTVILKVVHPHGGHDDN